MFVVSAFSLGQQSSPPRPAITGISHLVLFADDIPKSAEFYGSLLGWEQVPAMGAQSGVRFYANHLQYVELVSAPKLGMMDRLDSVAFATSDAEALRQYLGAHGVAVPDAVTVESNGDRSFMVVDPEGNKVGFTQAGAHPPTMPKDAERRLSAHIMHAGYVVRDRAALDHFYKDLLGFHLYWQGGNPADRVDWVMMQVPDGTDWIEYMLYLAGRALAGAAGQRQSPCAGGGECGGAAEAIRKARMETGSGEESAGAGCGWEDAAGSERSGRDEGGVYGVPAGGDSLLFSLYGEAAQRFLFVVAHYLRVGRAHDSFVGGEKTGRLTDVSSSNPTWWPEPAVRRNFSNAAFISVALW